MGCFLSCFRARTDPSGGGLHDPLVRQSRLGDAFLHDDAAAATKLEASGGTAKENLGNGGGVDDDLRREANYLKSCGTISATPPEILKVSNQNTAEDIDEANYLNSCGTVSENPPEILKVSSQNTAEYIDKVRSEILKISSQNTAEDIDKENYLNSCGTISETPPEILKVSNQNTAEDIDMANYLNSCGTVPETPPEILTVSNQNTAEDIDTCNDTSNNAQTIIGAMVVEDEDTLSEGFNCDGHDTLKHDQNIDEGAEHLTEVESVPRSSLQDKSSCQNIRNQKVDSGDSPFPTPLVLRGDIQTPGTIYTAYHGNLKSGKRGRTSRQFIYPVLRPIENKLQWAELRDDSSPVLSSNPPKRRYLSADSIEKRQQTFSSSVTTKTELPEPAPFSFQANNKEQGEEVTSPEEPKNQHGNQQLPDDGSGELLKNYSENGKHGVASLSCWLKTSSADGESQSGIGGNVGKQQGFERSAITDVPIFVASGLNWDNDNPTPVLPKAWDGNGIPNTTTKYKEDQKVSWHATPFEERLLKVLSDEKPHHERKISGKLIQLEEDAE